jgi:hypothetical protein
MYGYGSLINRLEERWRREARAGRITSTTAHGRNRKLGELVKGEGKRPEQRGEDGPLMQALVSSTGYSSDAFERDEEQFIYDLERSRVSRKSVKKAKRMRQESSSCGVRGARGAPFAFKRRAARIDWRSLHSVDVDRLIREVGNVMQLGFMMFIRVEKKKLNVFVNSLINVALQMSFGLI